MSCIHSPMSCRLLCNLCKWIGVKDKKKSLAETNLDHYCDITTGAVTSQITSPTIVYSTVFSDADQRINQSSASLAFVWGIHRRPVNSPHKWPVTRKMFPFDDVIMSDPFIICIHFFCNIIFHSYTRIEIIIKTIIGYEYFIGHNSSYRNANFVSYNLCYQYNDA